MNETYLSLDLQDCPEGTVLCPVDSSPSVDAYFENWCAPLTPWAYWKWPSFLAVKHVNGRAVLHLDIAPAEGQWGPIRCDRALISRGEVPADCVITASVALLSDQTVPIQDKLDNDRAWAGLVARMRDIRHYYFLCIRMPGQLALIRRSDDEWYDLAVEKIDLELGRWYRLAIRCFADRLECSLDGERVFAATDYHYPRGRAGVRANTGAYVEGLKVEAQESAVRRLNAVIRKDEDEREKLAAQLPQPQVLNSFNLPEQIDTISLVSTLACDTEAHLLGQGKDRTGRPITACLDLQGRIIWEQALATRRHALIARKDGGHDMFAFAGEHDLVVVDGATGGIRRRRPAPALDEPDRIWNFSPTTAVNLSGQDQGGQFIIRESMRSGGAGWKLWALSEDLEILWQREVDPPFGHNWSIGFADIDRDGREEVLAGATMLSPEGEVMWIWEDSRLMYWPSDGPDHVDAVAVGFFCEDDDHGPVAHLQCGSVGNAVVDALTGKTMGLHPIGHAQGRWVGRFVGDVGGLQVLVWCRWGSYGMINVFSAEGKKVSTSQPNFVGVGTPVNWTGDGCELFLLTHDAETAGLYDSEGRKLISLGQYFPGTSMPGAHVFDVWGDPRDEILLIADRCVTVLTAEPMKASRPRIYAPIRRQNISWPGWKEIE